MPFDTITSHETVGLVFNRVIKSFFFDKIKLFNDVNCVISFDVNQLFCMQNNVYYENDNSNAAVI